MSRNVLEQDVLAGAKRSGKLKGRKAKHEDGHTVLLFDAGSVGAAATLLTVYTSTQTKGRKVCVK